MERIVDPARPGAAGPFSPGLRAGEWVFLSGQGGFDPRTGKLVDGGIVEQTEQTLRNVAALLEAGGCGMQDVVSCAVHLGDLSLYRSFNEVYARHFGDPKPVRTTVGAALVLGMLVEITVVAHRPAPR
jgi:2-iminobutanoate/2-iminopropanoate deaminase